MLEAIANATKEQGGEMLQELKIGDEVNWLYEPRGGYGYSQQHRRRGHQARASEGSDQCGQAGGDQWVATKRGSTRAVDTTCWHQQ